MSAESETAALPVRWYDHRAGVVGAQSISELIAEAAIARRDVLPGLVGPGVTVLAGPPTVGKGEFARDLAVAVALDRPFLNISPLPKQRVLYVNTRMTPSKFAQHFKDMDMDSDTLARLDGRFGVVYRFGSAGIINSMVADVVGTAKGAERKFDFVVLDDVDHVMTESRRDFVRNLKDWAWNNSIPVLLVTHVAPAKANNPLLTLSDRSNAAFLADTVLVLNRRGARTTFRVYDSGVEAMYVAISNDDGWKTLGDAVPFEQSESRTQLLAVLKDATELMRPQELAMVTGMHPNTVDQLLYKMRGDGQVIRESRSMYRAADRADLQTNPTADNS